MPLKLIKKGKIFHVTGTIDGRRVRESTGTANRDNAEAFRRDLERDIEDRTYKKDSACWAEAMTYYMEKRGDSQKAFLAPLFDHFGAMRLKDITPVVVSSYVQDNLSHLEPSSIKRVFYTPMNSVMRAGHQAQLCPLMRFEPPKVKRKPVEYADDQWLRAFLEHAHARIALTVLFMTLTGARVSEACRVALADVDLARGQAILRKTKNGKSRRVILPARLVGLLQGWIESQRLDDQQAPLFGYAARWSVNQAIERVCIKAGIPVKSSHKVGRHAFAARLMAEGKGLKFLMEAGGWASIQIVAETYGHLEQSAIDDAMRVTGNDMITKMGSSVPMLAAPENFGHANGTLTQSDPLLDAIKKRHSLEESGDWDGGR